MTWPIVGALWVCAFFALGVLFIAYQWHAAELEHRERLREMQDEIDGIVR